MDIFELRPLIVNFNCKLSTVSEFNSNRQLLALISEENEIVLLYKSTKSTEVLKLVSWFRRTNRNIHDCCFDPSGTWLLVLCFDNTLHIVPALAVVDKTFGDETQKLTPYSTSQVTSYIIPFVGPHECPNSKKCPNQTIDIDIVKHDSHKGENEKDNQENFQIEENTDQRKLSQDESQIQEPPEMSVYSHDLPESMIANEKHLQANQQNADNFGANPIMASSFMASSTCPYPLSVVWWQTIDGMNRAIIGYSDGSICIVGLSPNCPFVASTAIESGSVVKLFICKDNTYESVMLMMTSSLKVQYKLLLEQKAIHYTYPGDNSPTNAPNGQESDWQIVMPLKQTTTSPNENVAMSSNATSDNENDQNPDKLIDENNDETIFPQTSTAQNVNNKSVAVPPRPPPPAFTQAQTSQPNPSLTTLPSTTAAQQQQISVTNPRQSYVNSNQMPPPPPYSVAINRHTDVAPSITSVASTSQACTSTTMSCGVRFQQQQLEGNRGGILPAARARLSSLKSLGSKKLTAIKMRLYDNRQKMEEYIPGNTQSSFTIMESPSLTPEVLGNTSGSFFSLQNLRSTYLISALHNQSNTLTVHTIDASLRPLFCYKIPKNCFHVLISSNILYTIQYVDIKQDSIRNNVDEGLGLESNVECSQSKDFTTEKESRDTDTEKQEIIEEDLDLGERTKDNILKNRTGNNDSTDSTSATTSGSSNSSNECVSPSNLINAVGVISSAMASYSGQEVKNKADSLLGLFRFENETVLNLHQMSTYFSNPTENITKEDKAKAFAFKDIRSPVDYVQFYTNATCKDEEFSLLQMEIMQSEFPKINYDPCFIVTNRNVFYIQLKKEPFAIFLDAALAGDWKQCREFCNTFDISYENCIEFAGDYLLRRHKVTQALLTYNSARVKPIRTALKLAMFGHTCALMQLCAMALKVTYLLKSKYFCNNMIKTILSDITYRHSEDVRAILPKSPAARSKDEYVNEGVSCSDYTYGVDEVLSNLQMSPSSQFHLANLLLITLAEKAVNDKNYIPLWNFLATNSKYHTNMTSIVLCQSGLYSSALILAKVRGVWLDAFTALTSVVAQEFGWYTELNVCLYNLSEPLFAETLTFMPQAASDYFNLIQEKVTQMRLCVLKRLEQQLNPFSAVLRPIVSHSSATQNENSSNDNNSRIFYYCKNLIETYLSVLIHMESQRSRKERISNALSTFRITYEDNQFAIESTKFKPISAGCAHCACVLNGVAYFWGSNGVPCVYNVNKSSDPPEPPHVVKSLDLLAELNLEVHAVKCGRQHTLILTNNGLYSFGNNAQSQLGIGNQTQVALQPMLVRTFDGKNITMLEAGQYHNAAVADGFLYTWGWGIYGQLGHGNAENVSIPIVVNFFKYKKIIQVSLGHAHSLVLCHGQAANSTELFVFGSNHFGQLGIGTGSSAGNEEASSDEFICANQVKSTVPLKLDISTSRLRLIHTKFFTNLAVDEDEKMYTWGSSPQALRLANQIKRRANAKQKFEEQQRREMSKQFEATIIQKTLIGTEGNEPEQVVRTSELIATRTVSTDNTIVSIEAENETDLLKGKNDVATDTTFAMSRLEIKEEKQTTNDARPSSCSEEIIKTEILATASNAKAVNLDDVDAVTANNEAPSLQVELLEEVTDEIVPSITQPIATKDPTQASSSNSEVGENKIERNENESKQTVLEIPDPSEHLTPHLVDTTEIAGQVLQLSSGLFHFACISSTCTLYTWGKNLEHQLGTEDKERRAVNKPMPLDNIESPMYVDCGADFTLVMTTDYVVKAVGGNSNGQCGRDLGPSIDKMKRVVCLPTTKRLMRFESQCVDIPVEINLPRPNALRLSGGAVRYLKTIPKFQPHFVHEADISFNDALNCIEQCSNSSRRYNLTSDNTVTGQESDDMISSLENLSNNEIINNYNNGGVVKQVLGLDNYNCSNDNSSYELTPDDQSYARLNEQQSNQILPAHGNLSNAGNGGREISLQSTVTSASHTSSGEDSLLDESMQQLRHYVHYCLYIFHGIYNPDRICEFSKNRLEYRIRILMLNFKFIDAFLLCLEDCDSAHKSMKVFEYYSKDTSFVPMRRQDLKYLIYYLLRHCLTHKFDILECERFFLADLDFYLIELSYVLYFNNNNTVLEQQLNEKFKDIFAQEESQQETQHKLEDAVIHVIYDSLSVKFKTVVCQKLLKYCSVN